MEIFYHSKEFSDCIIKSSDNGQNKLHRNILSQYSDVFKAMFTTEMKEGLTGEVQLDEDSRTLKNLFELIYIGETFYDFIQDLFALAKAANKYMIREIETLCIEELFNILLPRYVILILEFAHNYGYEDLKIKSLECIAK